MSQRNIFYYDQASNLICVRDTDLGLTYYEYDLLDRLTSVKNRFGEVTYYEYTADDEVSKQIHGNGAVSYYSYDPVGRVSRIEHRRSDLSEIATLDYEYDRVGNPKKITREDGSATYYSYDSIYQLSGEVQMAPGGQVEYAFEYDYDGAHNRTVKVANGTPTYYEYNAANQLLTETSGGETTYYHYDRCGNTVARQEPSGTTYFAYDSESLMTRVDLPEGGHCYYQYDADGKRVGQDTAEGHRTFVYEGPDMLKLQMERDENDQTIAQYTMGNGLEAMRRDDASSFYHYNHLGTTLALTDAEEAVTDTYRDDAWGVLLARTGTTDNPHTYVGRERYYSEADVALLLLGLRYYAPQIGRFVTVDPLRDGMNWITYAANDPLLLNDPTGLRPLESDEHEMLVEALNLLGCKDVGMYMVDVRRLRRGTYAAVIGGGGNPTIWLAPGFFGKDPPPHLYLPLLRAAAILHEVGHKQGLNEHEAYLLHNCFIYWHFARRSVGWRTTWRGWFGNEKYMPSNWRECAPQLCAEYAAVNWQDYCP